MSSCRKSSEKHSLRRIIVKVVEHSLTKQCLEKSQQSHREMQSNVARSRGKNVEDDTQVGDARTVTPLEFSDLEN